MKTPPVITPVDIVGSAVTLQALRFSVDADGIALVTLDRQDKTMNTIDLVLINELAGAIARIREDASIKGAVITSGKDAFLAGADLFDIEARLYDNLGRAAADMVEETYTLNQLLRPLEICGKPVACAFNGLALGGGFEVGLACHYRVAADAKHLQFGLPEVQVGLLPAGGGTGGSCRQATSRRRYGATAHTHRAAPAAGTCRHRQAGERVEPTRRAVRRTTRSRAWQPESSAVCRRGGRRECWNPKWT